MLKVRLYFGFKRLYDSYIYESLLFNYYRIQASGRRKRPLLTGWDEADCLAPLPPAVVTEMGKDDPVERQARQSTAAGVTGANGRTNHLATAPNQTGPPTHGRPADTTAQGRPGGVTEHTTQPAFGQPPPQRNSRQAGRAQKRQGWTPSGLPSWMGYFGRRRPDGIVIEYLHWRDRHRGPMHKDTVRVHLIEFTFTSEVSVAAAYAAKLAQYKEIIDALKQNGWRVQLHVLPMGVRGWMPEHTWDALGRLGVSRSRRQDLYERLSRLAVNSLTAINNTRRMLEIRGERDKTNKTKSGFHRFLQDKTEQAKLKRQENRTQAAGYRNRRRPRKGEG